MPLTAYLGGVVFLIWLLGPNQEQTGFTYRPIDYQDTLRFSTYRFIVTAGGTGPIRDLNVRAYRGSVLLTNIWIETNGIVVDAEVADLDNNRFPELYVYATSYGSGSFGSVYGWQFLASNKGDIFPVNWESIAVDGYMGHDSIWVQKPFICRKFPLYRPGDSNAEPTGGSQTFRYRLQKMDEDYVLIPLTR
ncbi:hypothetical protein GCM10023189_38160 [Nibrella saemangeumensis]|uniref:Uncharacterized protein n=1 Tax=Nibrella saemangeumensis TaxID=1084526 RepID=A0ABP8N910_9BACT